MRGALHETLGRLTDHYQVGGRFADGPARDYEDPSDLGMRDIDLTMTVPARRHSHWADSPRTWFTPTTAQFPAVEVGEWLRDTTDLPNPRQLIEVTDQDTTAWLALEGNYEWSEEQPPDEKALERPYRRVWYQLRSYLIPADAAAPVAAWAGAQNWMGRWMPEAADLAGLLLADHPDHPGGRRIWEREGNYWHRTKPPAPLTITTAWYTGCGSYDQSSEESILGFVPSPNLVDLLNLRRARDFAWEQKGARGSPPRTRPWSSPVPRPSWFAADVLTKLVQTGSFAVLWTVLGNKEHIVPHTAPRIEDDYHWLEFSAAYVLEATGPRLAGSTGYLQACGPFTIAELPWPLEGG